MVLLWSWWVISFTLASHRLALQVVYLAGEDRKRHAVGALGSRSAGRSRSGSGQGPTCTKLCRHITLPVRTGGGARYRWKALGEPVPGP